MMYSLMSDDDDDDASHVHSIICWRCTQPHVLGINDFITLSGVLLYYNEGC